MALPSQHVGQLERHLGGGHDAIHPLEPVEGVFVRGPIHRRGGTCVAHERLHERTLDDLGQRVESIDRRIRIAEANQVVLERGLERPDAIAVDDLRHRRQEVSRAVEVALSCDQPRAGSHRRRPRRRDGAVSDGLGLADRGAPAFDVAEQEPSLSDTDPRPDQCGLLAGKSRQPHRGFEMLDGRVHASTIALDLAEHDLEPDLRGQRAAILRGLERAIDQLSSVAIVAGVGERVGLVHQMGRHTASREPLGQVLLCLRA